MKRLMVSTAGLALLGAVGLAAPQEASAANDCSFTVDGNTSYLEGDCTTDATIAIPDGVTLDGQGFAITAVDPSGGHFLGPVVTNAGTEAHVVNLVVNTQNLTNACDAGDDRLRGIMFEDASGSITRSSIQNINQGPSGCQEGNAIEVRNAPFDGTGTDADMHTVEIAHNVVEGYQKTGVVCNGNVDCWIHHNVVSESATQQNLAANSVQIGYDAIALVEHNHIAGNQWFGFDADSSNYAGSAVLLYDAAPTDVSQNNIGGNADYGIFGYSDVVLADNNRIFDGGPDEGGYDVGVGDYGAGSSYTNNKIRGYEMPTDGDDLTGTKVIPSPHE